MAMSALELIVSVSASVYVCMSAEWAYDCLSPPLLCDEITTTLVIAEVVCKGNQGVEMSQFKFHRAIIFFVSLIYTDNMPFSYTKVQTFFAWTLRFYKDIGVIRYIVPKK